MRARVIAAGVFALFYFGMFIYPALRILTLAFPTLQLTTGLLLVILVGPVAGRLAHEWFPNIATRWLSALVLTWMGVCFVGFSVVLVFEVLNLLFVVDQQAAGWTLLAATIAISGYGVMNAQRLTIRTVDIPAPEHLRGVTLAQISDVHIGSRSGRFLQRIVRRTNALNPTFVVITGDLVDFNDISQRELAALADLNAPTYAIVGNHERYIDLEAIVGRWTTLGFNVLRDASIDLGQIQLVGIDDADSKAHLSNKLLEITPMQDRYRILLYHRPDGVVDAARWGFDLMLCGHTHNGQIFPFNYLVKRFFKYTSGHYRVGNLDLYVSPGTGTWGPIMRLGSRSEIGMIRLR